VAPLPSAQRGAHRRRGHRQSLLFLFVVDAGLHRYREAILPNDDPEAMNALGFPAGNGRQIDTLSRLRELPKQVEDILGAIGSQGVTQELEHSVQLWRGDVEKELEACPEYLTTSQQGSSCWSLKSRNLAVVDDSCQLGKSSVKTSDRPPPQPRKNVFVWHLSQLPTYVTTKIT
jgi:hypothetical protein